MPDDPNEARSDLLSTQEVKDLAVEGGSATVAALVGFAVGGPLGAAIGAATPPLVIRAVRISRRALDRRERRGRQVAESAIAVAGLSDAELVGRLEDDPALADAFLRLVKIAAESDESLGSAFGRLAAALLLEPEASERVEVLVDAMRDLRRTHIRVLLSLRARDGKRKAIDISKDVGMSEVELRSVVRSLEARGMIKDSSHDPMTWSLRELGKAVADYVAE